MAGNTEDGSVRPGNRWRLAVWGAAALALLIPFVAMQLTDEVAWDPADFIVFGAMLFAACGAYELAARMTENIAYRTAAGIALAAAFFLVWINGAVGIIGSEDNPANLMFAGVLLVGITAAFITRFRPNGMARAMLATAIAQALVGAIALIAQLGNILIPTGLFVALWLTSAWLFQKAEREHNHGAD